MKSMESTFQSGLIQTLQLHVNFPLGPCDVLIPRKMEKLPVALPLGLGNYLDQLQGHLAVFNHLHVPHHSANQYFSSQVMSGQVGPHFISNINAQGVQLASVHW